jgi:F0F1-type ATP synthase membrane subunit c/vacuolar-type H+-ATPase subunit K
VGSGEVVGNSAAAGLVVVSAGAVAPGLAAGVTVSVFCSQAANRPALVRMQMYFFIVVVEKPVFV